jgi:hypothetical protein
MNISVGWVTVGVGLCAAVGALCVGLALRTEAGRAALAAGGVRLAAAMLAVVERLLADQVVRQAVRRGDGVSAGEVRLARVRRARVALGPEPHPSATSVWRPLS